MRSLWQRFVHWRYALGAAAGALLVLAIAPPLVVATRLERTRGDIWDADDWTALWATLSSAVLFFLIALVIGVRDKERASALADAELNRTVGALAASGSRSFAGDETHALRVPSEALGALKHYQAAGRKERKRLALAIRRAFADIVFGTACHADALPRSIWTRLCIGMNDLVFELPRRIEIEPCQKLKDELRATLWLVEFARELGTLLRKESWKLSPGDSLDLSKCFDALDADTEGRTHDSADQRLTVSERLYEEELTVISSWDVLRRNPGKGESAQVKADVKICLEDVKNGEAWYSPWYLLQQPTDVGVMGPVDVNRGELGEASRRDRPKRVASLPEWPMPLLHRQLPEGLRERGIQRAKELLQDQGTPVTVCVLLYEFADVSVGDQPARLVLDGNHRLAGALRLAKDSPPDEREACPIRVLAFVITERERIDTFVPPGTFKKAKKWHWHGFTPDVENIRFKPGDNLDDLLHRADGPST